MSSEPAVRGDVPAAPHDHDTARLHQLGYAQELARHMSGFSNFAVSFTIISILSGCLTLYGFGLNTGGPAVIVWGWPFVGLMTLFLGLQFGFDARPWHTILLFGLILVLHGGLNQFGVRVVARLNDISVWWHVVGVAVIVGVLAFVPDKHQSASFVFTEFVNNTGFQSSLYVALIGLLLAQYTLTGDDASAHMTEETRDASRAGPRGIVMSIVVSVVAGWILLIGLTFAIQSYDSATGTETGVPPAQIFIDAVGDTGGKLLLLIAIGAQLFCGMASVTAN